jgi:tryptophanase
MLLKLQDLQRILDKSIELQKISQLCSDVEVDSLNVKKFSIKNLKNTKELIKLQDQPFEFLNKIERFRDHVHNIKEEKELMQEEHDNLIEENNRLKHCLRTYLGNVTRMPSICPIAPI